MARDFRCDASTVAAAAVGRLRGFYLDGVYCFHGIRYATAERFMPPVAEPAWEGTRDALSYGYVAPLMSPNSPNGNLLIPHRFWTESEDCLNLNVWTGALDPDARKPVMVWLHGGGYSAGSSIEMVAYEGDNMARYGDCVVVSVNHRLNILGYFDLSSFGAEFANAGNAGQADIVEALRWVRDNITAFGGDPDNVTIFGQSGGGGKVLSLLQTPEADGLFHKGIMMSGGAGRRRPHVRHDRQIAEMLIRELGGEDVSVLQKVPFADLVRAFDAITPALRELPGFSPMMWAPVANDWYVGDPWDVGYTDHARTVPLMVGSVIAEWGFDTDVHDKDSYDPDRRRAMIADAYGEEIADRLIAEFKAVYPDKNELILVSMNNRSGLLEFADKRSADADAPLYIYQFNFDFPYNGGMAAWHCSDIPFAFHNTEHVAICNVPGVSDGLEQAYFGAYMAFARTGSPNGRGLAPWAPYTADDRVTMFFDARSEARSDADTRLQQLHDTVAADPFAAMHAKPKEKKMTF